MIGDVLVSTRGAQSFMLSIGESVGHRVWLEPRERDNRFVGQLALPF